MAEPSYRQPTVAEAVAWLLVHRRGLFRQYRRECLRYWREKYGEDFGQAVEAKAKAAFQKQSQKPGVTNGQQ